MYQQLFAIFTAFLAFPSLSFGQSDIDWPDHQIKPASPTIYPLFSHGSGCPGSSERDDTLIGATMGASRPDGTFEAMIYLPDSMSVKAPDETSKACLSAWQVRMTFSSFFAPHIPEFPQQRSTRQLISSPWEISNSTGYAMRLHKIGVVNGTGVAGGYTLREGDEFTWTTQYIVPSNGSLRWEPVAPSTTYGFTRITDKVHLVGPMTPPEPNSQNISEVYKEATVIDEKELVPLPCGDAVFAIYTEFNLKAKSKDAKVEPYPVGHFELDITHDWVKC
ncbi:hypothetical protein F5B21DRAFT_503159 [Xylaria acuta]|nr:hypothetical protein F5B21DRAFT_503159 [Xylaria acuta]